MHGIILQKDHDNNNMYNKAISDTVYEKQSHMHINGNIIAALMPLPVVNVAKCDIESWEWPGGDEAA